MSETHWVSIRPSTTILAFAVLSGISVFFLGSYLYVSKHGEPSALAKNATRKHLAGNQIGERVPDRHWKSHFIWLTRQGAEVEDDPRRKAGLDRNNEVYPHFWRFFQSESQTITCPHFSPPPSSSATSISIHLLQEKVPVGQEAPESLSSLDRLKQFSQWPGLSRVHLSDQVFFSRCLPEGRSCEINTNQGGLLGS